VKPLLATLLMLSPALPVCADDWAIGGFDAVSFAQSAQPLPGRGDISTMWKGELWHFASEENRARFEADPRSFAPVFGGLCPVALAEGQRVPGDPRHFVIIGTKLYLLRSDQDERRFKAEPRPILSRAYEVWTRR